MTDYTRNTGSATHLIELYDTGRSQWLWRCIKCQLQNTSALKLTSLTCIPNGIDYAVAPDLLAALEGMQTAKGCFDTCRWEYSGRHHASCLEATYAIAKARGSE